MRRRKGGPHLIQRSVPIQIGKNIHLHVIKTDKFKTNLIDVYFQRPLCKEEATQNALITMVLPRGTETLPTSKEISKNLDELYGASMGSAVQKKGERQIIQFRIQLPNQQYIKDSKFLKKGLQILNELIHRPYTIDGVFHSEYVRQEKENLKEKIEGRKTDKIRYAYERCIEEMCAEERFALHEYGEIGNIDDITEKSLYDHYQTVLRSSPIDICAVGDLDAEAVKDLIMNEFTFAQNQVISIEKEKIDFVPRKVNVVNEYMDITQGKLNLGYRANIPFENDLYYALLVYSNILGGGPNSKLFQIVRERESLCYYIFSRIQKFKSLMLIGSGIEFENYERVLSLIEEQISEMREGNFTDEAIQNAKNSLTTSIRSLTDSPGALADFYYTQTIGNQYVDIEEMIQKIMNVTREEIIKAGENIKLDTIYFLRNEKESR